MMVGSIFIVAVERSGDDLGAGLINSIEALAPNTIMHGIGGHAMARAGVSSQYGISELSILGFVEALKSYPVVKRKVNEAVSLILSKNPAAVVLIDSWGFMLRVAWGLRKAGYKGKLIKYVAPQVWAMREGRAKVLAKAVDHLLTIHNFDAPYFERHGLPVTYVGNPVFDVDYLSGDAQALNIPSASKVMALMFGSRPAEIERLIGPFAETVEIVRQTYNDITIVSPISDSLTEEVKRILETDSRLSEVMFVSETQKLSVFARADVALACSGTVTTQLACAGVPTVVGYRLSPVTFHIAKKLFKPDYISIVNIAANSRLMPEYVQQDCNGKVLASAVMEYIDNPSLRADTSKALIKQTNLMRGDDNKANVRAAKAVLNII